MKRVFFLAWLVMLVFLIPAGASEKRSPKPAKNVVTGIRFEVIPVENTIIFLDGKKLGDASKIGVVAVKPGRHLVRLVHNKDEVEVDVVVANKQILDFKYAFEDSGKGISGFESEEKEDSIVKKEGEKAGEKNEEQSDIEKSAE